MRHLIISAVALFATITLSAQPHGDPPRGGDPSVHIELIAQSLGLSDQRQSDFVEIYKHYNEEMGQIARRDRGGKDLTDEQIEQRILQSFDHSEETTALKRKYYYKFKEVLSPKEILRMYNVEREFRRRINAEQQRRMGGKAAPNNR